MRINMINENNASDNEVLEEKNEVLSTVKCSLNEESLNDLTREDDSVGNNEIKLQNLLSELDEVTAENSIKSEQDYLQNNKNKEENKFFLSVNKNINGETNNIEKVIDPHKEDIQVPLSLHDPTIPPTHSPPSQPQQSTHNSQPRSTSHQPQNQQFINLQEENLKLKSDLANLHKNQATQIKELQTQLELQHFEGEKVKEELTQQLNNTQKQSLQKQQQQQQIIQNLEKQMKMYRQERDQGVMRFAESERKKEEMRQAMEKSELIVRGWGREREAGLNRWRVVCDENKRAFQVCDIQKQEIAELKKDIQRLNELSTSHQTITKTTNNKLKQEHDSHKETSARFMEETRRMEEVRREVVCMQELICDIFLTLKELNVRPIQTTKNTPNPTTHITTTFTTTKPIITILTTTTPTTATPTTTTLTSTQTTTKATKIDTSNIIKMLLTLRKDLHQLHWKQKEIVSEMLTYKDKIHCLEMEYKARSEEVVVLREVAEEHQQQTQLQTLLQLKQNKITELECQEAEMETEMSAVKQRCTETLSCNHKLSQLNCTLQSHNTSLQKQMSELSEKSIAITELVTSLQTQVKSLSREKELCETHQKESISQLQCQLQQSQENLERKVKAWKEMSDELKTLKRRYLSVVKDLRKQLSGKDPADSTSIYSSISHADSSLSLDTLATNQIPSSCHACETCEDNKVTIETLKKELQRKTNSVEFYSEHVDKLTQELNNKTRQLRNVEARKEMSMLLQDASPLHQHLLREPDEITKMFKVLLEETLTKNIQLKESVETLGHEIDCLTKDNSLLRQRFDHNKDSLSIKCRKNEILNNLESKEAPNRCQDTKDQGEELSSRLHMAVDLNNNHEIKHPAESL